LWSVLVTEAVPFARAGPRDPRPLVLHVIFRLDYGGLENGLVNLINRMPERLFRHAIVCLAGYSEFRARLRRPDVQVYSLGKRRGKDLPVYGRFWNLLHALEPSIVHTRNLGTIDLQWVAFAAGIRLRIHGEHGWGAADPQGRSRKNLLIRRLCRAVVSRYVAVSRDIADWLTETVHVPPERVVQIYNGVDTEQFGPDGPAAARIPATHRRGDGRIIFGTVGRLDPVKNQGALLEAAARLVERRVAREHFRLIVAGEGPSAATLRQQAERLGIADLVWFAGACADVPQILRAMDVFVLPSLNEGISNTLLEAMATGLPAVATRVGGNPELIDSGRTGVLCEPDDLPGLTDAMLQYAEKPALRTAHGAAARERAVQRFALDAMVGRYTDLYRDLCAEMSRKLLAA
jgi:sugar transferase (PEP-CTERM/EpsH1 system associated)